MASPWGGMGGSGPPSPTSLQTPPEICANSLRSVLCIEGGGGGPMHVYCNFLLLTSNKKMFGPPTFFGLATPLDNSFASSNCSRFKVNSNWNCFSSRRDEPTSDTGSRVGGPNRPAGGERGGLAGVGEGVQMT